MEFKSLKYSDSISPKIRFCKASLTSVHQFKGGYLDFSHLTELKKIYITEIYMKKQYKSSITKNHKIIQKKFLMVLTFKGYVAS